MLRRSSIDSIIYLIPIMMIDTSFRSPNYGPRGSKPVSMLVLHATVGSARSALAWLTNPSARVSAHYLIDKSGQIYQLVADDHAAWHAGHGSWRGETAINECSIGIEVENANNGHDPYPQAQIDALLQLARDKIIQHKIAPEMVVRHLDIALPRGRKSDPAGFPWSSFLKQLFAQIPSLPPERPPRPIAPAASNAALTRSLLTEAYRQVGAVEWPEWSMARIARLHGLGMPVGPTFELNVDSRNIIAQSFGRETLFSPIGDWRRVDRLSALNGPEKQTLRDALLKAVYKQAGETFHPEWAFHQFAQQHPIGPPLSAGIKLNVGGTEYIAACYALDVLYSQAGHWEQVGQLSQLTGKPELTQALQELLYRRVGSQLRPGWPAQQIAHREHLGAPLGPSYRVTADGRDYVAEAFALDVVYCEVGTWANVNRLSTLLDNT